jgi:hypothetical protein
MIVGFWGLGIRWIHLEEGRKRDGRLEGAMDGTDRHGWDGDPKTPTIKKSIIIIINNKNKSFFNK